MDISRCLLSVLVDLKSKTKTHLIIEMFERNEMKTDERNGGWNGSKQTR